MSWNRHETSSKTAFENYEVLLLPFKSNVELKSSTGATWISLDTQVSWEKAKKSKKLKTNNRILVTICSAFKELWRNRSSWNQSIGYRWWRYTEWTHKTGKSERRKESVRNDQYFCGNPAGLCGDTMTYTNRDINEVPFTDNVRNTFAMEMELVHSDHIWTEHIELSSINSRAFHGRKETYL